ncbi:sensor histidine kinase [Holdemanella porci]|uniref:sensor histidine kinase n=1 Tax=Holdemanella porci TaxID=2652276 RepID=UPI003AF035EC
MKLFGHYLKDRLFFIMIYVVSVFVCFCVFKLYNLELEAFTYAFMLLCVLLVVCFLFDYYKYYKKHQTLVTLQSNSNVSLSCDLQDSSLMGEDYHKILVAMKEYHDEYVISSENKMHDLEDYFTMWVHQAKLPIAAMKLLLEDEKLSRSEIKLQLLRMDQYTDMVLAYLRLHSTHTDFLFKELELDDLIRQSIRRFSTEFIRKHIQLSFKETGDVILSDEKWLVFVLEQILSNSLKYTNENGLISIYMNSKHVLVIEDTGIGISASDLNRVFEKGYTGINGRSDKTASGLGLYLCKNIWLNRYIGDLLI